MNSCADSCCTCFRKVLCASGTSVSWPTGDAPHSCRFAFRCSARHHLRRRSKRPHLPMAQAIFGSAPSVLDRWWSSKGSPPPRFTFVLRPSWPLLPHETTLHSANTLRASARSVVLRLVAEQISSSHFVMLSIRGHLALPEVSPRSVLPSALCGVAPSRLNNALPLNSNCIGSASAANAGGFLQVAVSKARQSTLLPSSFFR